MRALLLKDCYYIFNEDKLFLFIVLALSILSGLQTGATFMHGFALIFSLGSIRLTFSADTKSNFFKHSKILTYSDFKIVLSKYFLGYLSLLIPTIISILSGYTLTNPLNAPVGYYIHSLSTTACIFAIFMSIQLPAIFKFGVEKGRLMNFLFEIILLILITFLSDTFNDLFNTLYNNFVIMLSFTIIISIISFIISLKFYKQKVYN